MSITSESWWGREVIPASLSALGARLRAHYRLAAVAIGIKGNTAHVYGYHRSANWVRNSAYCTNRTYSVTETPGNRRPGNPDWLCALDATLPHDDLVAACKRLDEAVRAGRLEKVTEWYGNDDGDNRVDGYDNIRNRVATSDPSHLWHLHISFDRGRAGEDHTDVYEILTGDDMPTVDEIVAALAKSKVFLDAVSDAVWLKSDKIPAPREPYNNPDLATNPTWGPQNTLRELVEDGRRHHEEEMRAIAALSGGTPGGEYEASGSIMLTPKADPPPVPPGT